MADNIYIPKICKVGFNERWDTVNGKLGFVIYNNGKVWRQEKSWLGWIKKPDTEEFTKEEIVSQTNTFKQHLRRYYNANRNLEQNTYPKIEDYVDKHMADFEPNLSKYTKDTSFIPIVFDNEPTEGFVLNKKVGGNNYSWNNRNTYCRVYDPRGFEIEISIYNLLFILECTNSIIGKGLEGEFVYGWSGKNLILVPCNSKDYESFIEFSEVKGTKINPKKLISGGIYIDNFNIKIMYIGFNNDKYWMYRYDTKQITNSKKINVCKHVDTDLAFYNTIYPNLSQNPKYVGIKNTIYSPIQTGDEVSYRYFYYSTNLYRRYKDDNWIACEEYNVRQNTDTYFPDVYKYYSVNKDNIVYYKKQYILNDNKIIDKDKYDEIRL
jgi:hypothetical protein